MGNIYSHRAEDFAQRFRIRAHALLQLYLAEFVQHAVPAVAIPQIQSDGQFLLRNIPALLRHYGANFSLRLLFICTSSTSITWERTPHPVRRPAFSSHLISTPSNFVRKQPPLDQRHPNVRADCGFTVVCREYVSMQSRFTHIFVAAVCSSFPH